MCYMWMPFFRIGGWDLKPFHSGEPAAAASVQHDSFGSKTASNSNMFFLCIDSVIYI